MCIEQVKKYREDVAAGLVPLTPGGPLAGAPSSATLAAGVSGAGGVSAVSAATTGENPEPGSADLSARHPSAMLPAGWDASASYSQDIAAGIANFI